MSGDRWAVFGVAWPVERAARMDTSLARVRDWLAADGAQGLGCGGPERTAARQRAMASGLTSQEAWLVSDVLVADARRLMAPGGRVQERAKRVTGAVTEAQTGLRPRTVASRGSAGVLGLSEVTRYAVVEHGWTAEDRTLVVEDLPWGMREDRQGLWALPVTWLGVVVDPPTLGLHGDDWREGFWRNGNPRPAWADDPAARKRVMAYVRAFGWNGLPLRADLDDVEPYLPLVHRGRGRPEHLAWLVPGISGAGWALAWTVPSTARV